MSDPCLTLREGACDGCGKLLKGRQKRWCSRQCHRRHVANHRWTQAKALAKEKATWFQCAVCGGFFREVEVDHIVPCKGKHGQWGCWHHEDNLRVLCHGCHVKKTNDDRERGWT